MYKFLLLLALFATALQAQETSSFAAAGTQVALGDTGSIKSSLSDDENAPVQAWAQLSDDQRKVLTPLASEWDTLRPWQRAKMLDIAKDYPSMDAQKQQRVQKRLTSWSRMTPYERENARKRYQQFHALSAEKKDEIRKKWAEHQKLPEAEREIKRKESGELDYDPDLYN
jgi:Protein of unknown function (DUF3106)